MSLGRAKLVECIKSQAAVVATRLITPNTVTWNGTAGATVGTANGIDCQGYENALFFANVGAMLGAQGLSTVSIAIYENDSNSATPATAITGADFTNITYANQSTAQVGSIVTRERKRYLWARVSVQGAVSPTIDLGVTCILARGGDMPPTDTIAFDVQTNA